MAWTRAISSDGSTPFWSNEYGEVTWSQPFQEIAANPYFTGYDENGQPTFYNAPASGYNSLDLWANGIAGNWDEQGVTYTPTAAGQAQLAANQAKKWSFADSLGGYWSGMTGNDTLTPATNPYSDYLQQTYGSAMDTAYRGIQDQRAASQPGQKYLQADPYNFGGSNEWDINNVIIPAMQQAGMWNDPKAQSWLGTLQDTGAQSRARDQTIQAQLDADFNKRVMTMIAVTGGVMGAGALGAFGAGGAGGLAGGEAAAAGGLGEAAGSAGWGVTQGAGGGGMSWIDALSQYGGLESLGGLNAGELAGLGVTPESLGLGAGAGYGNTGLEDYFSDFGSNFGPTGEGMYPTGAEDFTGAWGQVGGGSSSLDYLKRAQDLYKMMGGGGGGGAGGGDAGWGTNLFGGGGGGWGDLLGKGIGLSAALGAVNYGYKQTGFDTGRLEDLYGQYNPQAMAGLYDMNTGLERDQLTSSLGRRGVLGSSFGNMDLANFNTRRDIGRSQLISGAVQPAAGIAGQILGANIAEQKLKNDLIGQGARAIGSMFGGGGGAAGGGMTGSGGSSGGNDWLSAILRSVGGGGTQTASYPNPLDVWNV